jgi:DNA-binding NtrC family response regulator
LVVLAFAPFTVRDVKEALAIKTIPIRSNPGGNPALTSLSKPVVLVVEDEQLIRDSLADALQDAGFGVVQADKAETAIARMVEAESISAVVTDVRLPGRMNGVGIAVWMREHTPETPIILVSGFPIRPDLAKINPKIAIIVNKPYQPDEIVGWVCSLVEAGSMSE